VDALVEFLFKYRPIVWENGHLAIGASWPTRIAVLLLGALAFAAVVTYVQVRMRGTQIDRRKLIALRAVLLLLLVFILLQPVLVVSAAVGRRNVVGVVVDDSRSMQVADMEGRTRADVVRSLLGGADSALLKALDERFTVRFFRVGGDGSRVNNLAEVPFDAPNTRLASALEGARQELAGIPLSGLVLVSDGADNAPGKLTETLLSLNARKVPVYTLGVGQSRFAKDIEVSRVEAPHSVLKGAAVVMSIDIAQRGFGGNTVKVTAEDSGRVVGMETVTLPKDGEATTVRVRVPTSSVGARVFTVRVAAQDGEMVKENNARSVMVMVRDRREKILYIEGELRPEFAFLRRALDQDENLQLVTLIRTAKDRFMRQGIDDSLELVDGFPVKREELFQYRAIVLGSIEASYFTVDQLRLISDFVSERGGGLLMLGGRKSFAEGGYARTPIADVLPVELPKGLVEAPAFREVKVGLTSAGAIYPVTQIGASETASVTRWKKMPVVTSVNRILGAKPGAGTFLVGTAPKGGKKQEVVLAYHRYGLGSVFAFPVQDSWQWRMHASVPLEDETYKSFWRQVLRSLVNDVPNRVMVSTSGDQVGANEPLRINADVADKSYLKVNGAKVSATVLAPSGSIVELPLEWTGVRDGEYYAMYTPKEEGVHNVRVTAHTGADMVLSDPAFVQVGTPAAEYFGAEQRTALLRRVAEETGGRYYTPASAVSIAKDLVYSPSGNNAPERLDLWDMPIFFIILLALVAVEWIYRRRRGLI
jgi:uncharacterized membrane protein